MIARITLTDNVYYLDSDAQLIAEQVAAGDYQRSLVRGRARWSGADLRGTAARYGARYAGSRGSLVHAMRRAGLLLTWAEGPKGLRVLIVSSEPTTVRVEGARTSHAVAVIEGHPAIDVGCFTAI